MIKQRENTLCAVSKCKTESKFGERLHLKKVNEAVLKNFFSPNFIEN